MARLFLTGALMLELVLSGCKVESRSAPERVAKPAGEEEGADHQKSALQAEGVHPVVPTLHLRVYPDMAVPGKEVVLEAEVSPLLASDQADIAFRTLSDPCRGTLSVDGWKAIYKVPPDCRGSGIQFEVTATGAFGEVRRTVKIDLKKAAHMTSVVFNHPVPGQKVWSPIPVWWDRTLYQNRNETLSFSLTRRSEVILTTRDLPPDAVIELDIPPSPEDVVLTGKTSSGTIETALLKVHGRQVPHWAAGSLVIDSFSLPDVNSLNEPRKVLTDGGKCSTGIGYRISAKGEETFLFLRYHVSKSKRYSRSAALMGIEEKVTVRADRTQYGRLVVWLKGDPVRGMAGPVYVRVEGSAGSKRVFKIKHVREDWVGFRFPLASAFRKSKEESVRRVLVYLDARDVIPPLGTILLGGMLLEPLSLSTVNQ